MLEVTVELSEADDNMSYERKPGKAARGLINASDEVDGLTAECKSSSSANGSKSTMATHRNNEQTRKARYVGW